MKLGMGSASRHQPQNSGRDSLFEDSGADYSRNPIDPEERLQSKFDKFFDQAADDYQQRDAFDGFDEVEFIDDGQK